MGALNFNQTSNFIAPAEFPTDHFPLITRHSRKAGTQLMLRAASARTLATHVQSALKKTTLPEEVTVVFDMDAWSFT
jgi:hypothetical protein